MKNPFVKTMEKEFFAGPRAFDSSKKRRGRYNGSMEFARYD